MYSHQIKSDFKVVSTSIGIIHQYVFYWTLNAKLRVKLSHIAASLHARTQKEFPPCAILLFYNSVRHQRLTKERPKCVLHHGKMLTNKCRAIRNYTRACSNGLKMWIKRLHTEIPQYNNNLHSLEIYFYFKIITCIILGLVISNVFACKTNSIFNDFVDSCVTGKCNRAGACIL